MNFGNRTDEKESFRILDLAVDQGINFIDTANQYGGSAGVGATESIIGRWIAANPHKRDKLVFATKVYEPMSADVNDRGLSARHIQMACDASLERLQLDHVELYQMHHFDRVAPAEEIWLAIERLRAAGKITYLGSSNFPGWVIAKMGEQAAHQNRLGLVSEQSLYNLLERRIELEVQPACDAYGLGLIPWSPLAGGLLATPEPGDSSGRRASALQNAAPGTVAALEKFDRLCAALSQPRHIIALAWLLHQPAVSATIVGPSSAEQLNNCIDVPQVELSAETLAEIDTIFPPCGAAPEAYAW